MNTYLAVDIGASTMRMILGWLENGTIQLQEVYRCPNVLETRNGHLCWNLNDLYSGIIEGLRQCKAIGKIADTMGIDTWAVDYVLLDAKDKILGDSVAYRDSRTDGMDRELEKVLPFDQHYSICGIAKQPFNTVYQLMAQFKEHPEHREATSFLMVPDYLNFLLTGVKKNEYTNCSSTAMLDAQAKDWSGTILDLEQHGMTMAEFVTLALDDELHPKQQQKEEQNMGNMRTIAFQVPEELFQKIKDYLQRNNISQKQFVIGLIEDELEREQTELESMAQEQTGGETQNQDMDEPEESQDVEATDYIEETEDEILAEAPADIPDEYQDEEIGEITDEQEAVDEDTVTEDEFDEEQDMESDEFQDEGIGEFNIEDDMDDEDEEETEDQGFSMGM